MSDVKPAARPRPLSPHLQIYRWQWTMALSILHRATGIALSVGTLLLVWWLVAAASDAASFQTAQEFLGSWLGILMLMGWTFAFWYHFANGIRHLIWDTGTWLDLPMAYRSGLGVVIFTAVMTILTWIAGFAAF
ncbi:MAG TPA: succinate dehydrogenase, cytochrome b556 subunit [Alphaproteobacteria bacterium]|nr:succinate dehydrogenase, cytochrome b556 subunit [Alphaproteobacteria bacterium]